MKRATHGKLPVWLRRLQDVKVELRAEHWLSEREGFEQGIQLLAFALNMPGQKSRLHRSGNFLKPEDRWIKRWRKERARVFHR